MPETEKRDQKVAVNARHIDEAAEHLENHAKGARRTARRTRESDSTASAGIEKTASDTEPVGEDNDEEHEDQEQ